MSDLVTVIVPVYNVSMFLAKCITSVIEQSFNKTEIILSDDGSYDDSALSCDEYALKDVRIITIHKINGGLSDSRNKGLDISNGKYVSFVDSDDWISTDHIESMYNAICISKSKLALCGIETFTNDGKTQIIFNPGNAGQILQSQEMFNTIWQPSACNKMFSRNLFRNVRFPFGRLYEDLCIYHDILASVDKLVFSGTLSYHYYLRPASIMNKPYDAANLDIVYGLDLRIKKLRQIGMKDLADQQLIYMINAIIRGYRELHLSNSENRKRLCDAQKTYRRNFIYVTKTKRLTFAQKIIAFIVLIFPKLIKKEL